MRQAAGRVVKWRAHLFVAIGNFPDSSCTSVQNPALNCAPFNRSGYCYGPIRTDEFRPRAIRWQLPRASRPGQDCDSWTWADAKFWYPHRYRI